MRAALRILRRLMRVHHIRGYGAGHPQGGVGLGDRLLGAGYL